MDWLLDGHQTRGTGQPSFRQAHVLDGDVLTSYRVAGGGAPIVVLSEPRLPLPLAGIPRDARLIVPDIAVAESCGRAFSAWLRGFLDGLGLSEVAMLAGSSHAAAALAFALVETGRVSRLVLLEQGVTDPVAPAGVIREELTCSGRPLLLVHLDPAGFAPPEVSSALRDFLASGTC